MRNAKLPSENKLNLPSWVWDAAYASRNRATSPPAVAWCALKRRAAHTHNFACPHSVPTPCPATASHLLMAAELDTQLPCGSRGGSCFLLRLLAVCGGRCLARTGKPCDLSKVTALSELDYSVGCSSQEEVTTQAQPPPFPYLGLASQC